MLIDEVTIKVKAGNGGNGVVSFKRNAQTARGGPDGGNGGKGGSVYFCGVNDISALQSFTYTKEVKGEDGIKGGKQNLFGRNGLDTTIYLPIGTVVTDLATGIKFEIIDTQTKVLVATGGKGGRGNNEFKSATVQAPKYRELGEPGEEKDLKLELKLIADIGLIGFPNAGKSSLLEALTNAHPKIGNYPFTTLEPNLGVMDNLILADIPGLIEGASSGKGLGIKFLKHIERTKVIVHCLDSASTDFMKDYEVIRNELKDYNEELLTKKELIAITKSDNLDQKQIEKIQKFFDKQKKEIVFISIYDDKLLEIFKEKLKELAA